MCNPAHACCTLHDFNKIIFFTLNVLKLCTFQFGYFSSQSHCEKSVWWWHLSRWAEDMYHKCSQSIPWEQISLYWMFRYKINVQLFFFYHGKMSNMLLFHFVYLHRGILKSALCVHSSVLPSVRPYVRGEISETAQWIFLILRRMKDL